MVDILELFFFFFYQKCTNNLTLKCHSLIAACSYFKLGLFLSQNELWCLLQHTWKECICSGVCIFVHIVLHFKPHSFFHLQLQEFCSYLSHKFSHLKSVFSFVTITNPFSRSFLHRKCSFYQKPQQYMQL